ncbi:hypothetical protein [Paraflavitalea speifideaquila]|uniref:hypothetical protein n=1 Tax=Paraflavitalea speifideaquila TaxID=3076558 RepID=UPI0028E9341B|nr:hypothetical protein [Paraflavitalea speifideiaquila]
MGAYLRGIDQFDIKATYEILLKNANTPGGARPHIEEYIKKAISPIRILPIPM